MVTKLEPKMIRDTEPWKRCPSTHCERRGECASPHECCIKPQTNPHWQDLSDAEQQAHYRE